MTAWDLFWLLFIFVPLTILWVFILADVIRRPDLIGWEKALWVAVIIFFPWLGALAYLVFRSAATAAEQRAGSVPQAAVPHEATTQVPAQSAPQSMPTPS